MKNISSIELNEIVSGPDLILRNGFRLTQMPVDCAERTLNKRQKMIDMANKMGIPLPVGQSPVFAIQNGDAYDDLKEALHLMRDPFNRLIAEIFWFWPQTFGDSKKDQGLKLLAKEDVKQTFKFWKQGELETENHVSTHNLAVLHQFIALQIDYRMIVDKAPLNGNKKLLFGLIGNKDEKNARKHWKESFKKWILLTQQDSFWAFIKQRIRTINDPRLPPDSGDWVRSNIASILISINAGLVFRAAENDLNYHIVRQRGILADSGFSTNDIDNVFDMLARKKRQRVTYLCEATKKEVKQDPVNAHDMTLNFLKQATPVLKFLANIYPDGNKTVDVLHDEVAETVLQCQTTYYNKTENWDVSIELLEAAKPLARGNEAKTRINDDIKVTLELKEAGNRWCEPGYFKLPKNCIDILEKARTFKDAEKFDEAIDYLRNALFGIWDLPDHPEFKKHLFHCIAYCLNRKSVLGYNRAMDDYNRDIEKIIIDSLVCDGHISSDYVACASCRESIYGEYVVRTIRGHRFPFCQSCNRNVENKFKRPTARLDKAKKETLDLVVLAHKLDPDFKSVVTNLRIIEEQTRDSNIQKRSPEDLKKDWNLVEPHELIASLIVSSESMTDNIFKKLTKIILLQSHRHQSISLQQLSTSIVKKGANITKLLPTLAEDNFILNEFLKRALYSPTDRTVLIESICNLVDFHLKFDLIDRFKKLLEDHESYSEAIIASMAKDFKLMISAAHEEGTLFTEKVFYFLNLMEYYSKYTSNVYLKQINNLLIGESSAVQITRSINSIKENSTYLDTFFIELLLSYPEMPLDRISTVYLAIYESASGSKTDISNRLAEHILQLDDPLRNEEMGKFIIFLLRDNYAGYEPIFESLTKNYERTLRLILLASETTNQRQAEKLSIIINTYLRHNNITPEDVDANLMIKGLLAASIPELSHTLMELNKRINPEFEKMTGKKSVIRDLKYLASKASGIQQETAQKIIQKKRQRSFFHRLNIFLWRPAKAFEISPKEDIWWAKDY